MLASEILATLTLPTWNLTILNIIGGYNRLIINNGNQKHNYICKYNNLPTTCFGLIRPSSGWNRGSEENYLSDLNAGVQGRGRDLVYKYGVIGWNGVGTSVCPFGEFICWSVGPRGWFLSHGGHVSEVVGLKWPLYVCCCGGSTPVMGDQVGAWLCCYSCKQ